MYIIDNKKENSYVLDVKADLNSLNIIAMRKVSFIMYIRIIKIEYQRMY